MSGKRHAEVQIIYAVKQADAGTTVKEILPATGRQRADVLCVEKEVQRDGR